MVEVWKKLSQAVTFPKNLQFPTVSDYPDFSGTFKQKLEYLLEHGKNLPHTDIKFDTFSWKKCEVGEMTGNQLLRALIALCRNQEVFTVGSCVILTINGAHDGAMYLLESGWLLMTAPGAEDAQNRKFYDKLFNEELCSRMKEDENLGKFFTDEMLSAVRCNVLETLRVFLQEPIVKTKENYRRAFIGLLHELVKFQLKGVPVFNVTGNIPVAACIYLAAKFCLSFKLQAVFGEINYSKHLYENWKKENPNHSKEGARQLLINEKRKRRIAAAKHILER